MERLRYSENESKVYGEHILGLMKQRHINQVTPRDILDDAANPATPYHKKFEWDDEVAGEQFRLIQASQLLRAVIEVVVLTPPGETESKEVSVRAFHSVEIEGKRGYAPREFVFSDKELAEQVINAALAEAERWKNKYGIYQELEEISEAIDKTIKKKKTNANALYVKVKDNIISKEKAVAMGI